MHNVPAHNAMSVSVSQRASGANPKRTFWEVFVVALVVSLSIHGTVVAWSAMKGPLVPPQASVAVADSSGATEVEDTDLVDVAKSSGDSVVRGDEDKAQGSPGVAPTADKERKAAAEEPKPADVPKSPPTHQAKPESTTASEMHSYPDPDHTSSSQSDRPDGPRPSTKSAPGSASSARADATDAVPSPGVPGDVPGQGGGQRRSGERDLASTFTHELPDCAYFVAAWTSLSAGDAGSEDAHVDVDADGKVTAITAAPHTTPPAALSDTLRCLQGKLRVGKLALRDGALAAGVMRVHVGAVVSDVPAPDRPGGAVAIEHTFDKDRGHASFTLESGRRVDFAISVLGVDRAP